MDPMDQEADGEEPGGDAAVEAQEHGEPPEDGPQADAAREGADPVPDGAGTSALDAIAADVAAIDAHIYSLRREHRAYAKLLVSAVTGRPPEADPPEDGAGADAEAEADVGSEAPVAGDAGGLDALAGVVHDIAVGLDALRHEDSDSVRDLRQALEQRREASSDAVGGGAPDAGASDPAAAYQNALADLEMPYIPQYGGQAAEEDRSNQ